MSVRFAIEEVFDLRQRGVILAAGRILHGTVAGPTMLRDERSGQVVRVLGVELLPAPAGDPDRIRLIIDRAPARRGRRRAWSWSSRPDGSRRSRPIAGRAG